MSAIRKPLERGDGVPPKDQTWRTRGIVAQLAYIEFDIILVCCQVWRFYKVSNLRPLRIDRYWFRKCIVTEIPYRNAIAGLNCSSLLS
jgi:hypothetical protein